MATTVDKTRVVNTEITETHSINILFLKRIFIRDEIINIEIIKINSINLIF